eukprot:g29956.t1
MARPSWFSMAQTITMGCWAVVDIPANVRMFTRWGNGCSSSQFVAGIRFRVESLSVESQEDHISFGCGTDPDQQKQFTLTKKHLNIMTFHLSNCTDSWVHFHSGPNVPNTRFKIYYEM